MSGEKKKEASIRRVSAGEVFSRDLDFLLFTHIPKCGGTSLHDNLAQMLDDKYVHFVPNQFDPDELPAKLGAGGHQSYEQHAANNLKRRRVYITMVREPFERFMSFYRHIQDHPKHYLPKGNPALIGMDPIGVAEYLVKIENREVSNLAMKMLSPPGDIGLSAALNNLEENYSLVGVAELYPVMLRQLATMLGRPAPEVKFSNVSSARKIETRDEVALRKMIYELNYNDLIIYQYCYKRVIDTLLTE